MLTGVNAGVVTATAVFHGDGSQLTNHIWWRRN